MKLKVLKKKTRMVTENKFYRLQYPFAVITPGPIYNLSIYECRRRQLQALQFRSSMK